MPAQQILVVGDEFGYGVGLLTIHTYAWYLQTLLEKSDYSDVSVISYARPGETMIGLQWSIDAFAKDLNRGDIVIMTIGNNDLKQSMTQSMIQVSLQDILETLDDKGVKVIAGVTMFDAGLDETVTNSYVSMLQRVVPARGGMVYVEMFTRIAWLPEYVKPNTIYPNEQGNEIVAQDLYTFLVTNGLLR